MSEQESKQSEPEVDAGWEAEDHSDSGKHVLAIGSIDAAAHGPCTCGCGVGPSWSLEVHADDGDWQAASFEDAQRKAERALRQMRDDLNQHFAPVLRWTPVDHRGEEMEGKFVVENGHPLSAWKLRAVSSGFTITWHIMGKGYSAKGQPLSGAMRAAENMLRSFGVVFRVEQNGGAQ